MDTGLTFRDAVLIASIPGILTAVVGYFLSLKSAARTICHRHDIVYASREDRGGAGAVCGSARLLRVHDVR